MKLDFLLLADYAFLSIDKKVNLIGIFESLNAKEFPVVHPSMHAVGSLKPDKLKFKMGVDILYEKESILESTERDVKIASTEENFNFIVELANVKFKKAGLHELVVTIDGKEVGKRPIKVVPAPVNISSGTA